MAARALTPSTAHATRRWREQCHHNRGGGTGGRGTGGGPDVFTSDIIARFLDEGVPEGDVLYVASETLGCAAALTAGDELPDHLHLWTRRIIGRYADKLDSLFMAARGKVDRV